MIDEGAQYPSLHKCWRGVTMTINHTSFTQAQRMGYSFEASNLPSEGRSVEVLLGQPIVCQEIKNQWHLADWGITTYEVILTFSSL